MPNIANVLKDEISRIARKELRGETDILKKTVAAQRREIVSMKKRMQALERLATKGSRVGTRIAAEKQSVDSDTKLRFSPTRFASQRKKLEMSAVDFALLLGVSSLSVYKWENGQTRPRRSALEAIAATRKLGKREAFERLEVLKAAPGR